MHVIKLLVRPMYPPTHLDIILVEHQNGCRVSMATAVIGGGEDGRHVRPDIVQHSVIGIRKSDSILFALMSPDYPQETILREKRLDGRISKEVGTATRRVGHEVQLQELKG